MNPDRQQAIDYLRAPDKGLWRWAEDGAVLVWRDGSTIAFREEIAQILEWLAPNGLPSLGAIVFLLAACRGKVPGSVDILGEKKSALPKDMGSDATLLLSARQQLKAQLESALVQLAKVSQLPSETITGLKARCVLAEAVFEPARAERHVQAHTVLRGMREPMTDAELADEQSPTVAGSYIRQIHIVAEGLRLQTAESLALRLCTGLDALPGEAEVDLPTAERARRLIEELSRDREFGAMARAARELMAAVRLPRRLGEREQLAMGGVADITNRGPLDRLLLSELAHDDLTLAVRVALNEALYLRREPPMREPPGTLALLLDSGVRLWGVPRVLATAVALALVARDKQHSEVLAWRAHGKQLPSVDLLSRYGLTQHLATLETTAHPGEALPAFAEAVAPGAQNQSVLITHRDALDDPEFRRALAENPVAPGFVAVVDREGHFQLHALPLARRPPLCEADLDLAAVFDDRKGVPPIKVEVDPGLPAIFGVSPFPFLLPIAGTLDFWVKGDDGFTYALLNDRRLVQFRDQRTGARVLASDLPGGKTLWMDCVEGVVHVVKAAASQRPARLVSISLDGTPRVTELVAGAEIRAVHRYGDVILLLRYSDVRAHALSDGRLLGHTLNPHRWVHGRYCRGENHFYFAAWDGQAVRFEPVTMSGTILTSNIVTIFNRDGMEDPWLLSRDGEVISASDGRRIVLKPTPADLKLVIHSTQVSRDGHKLFVPILDVSNKNRSVYGRSFDLIDETVQDLKRIPHPDFDRVPALPTWNLYRIVESVAWLPDGIAFRSRKNRWRKIVLDASRKLKIEDLATRDSHLWSEKSFAENPIKSRFGCTLRVAAWPNGSKVFLDSRGLLHLKSHDSSVPEVSLILSNNDVAGWTSGGHVCGPQFFFDYIHHSVPEKVFEGIQKALTGL